MTVDKIEFMTIINIMVKVVVILQDGHLYHCDEGGGDLAFNLAFCIINMTVLKVLVILNLLNFSTW